MTMPRRLISNPPLRLRARQRGNTLLGLIIGLILGLGIAVVVALYVNRAPVPTAVKNGNGKETPAAAQTEPRPAAPAEPADPNQPLYGSKPEPAPAAEKPAGEEPRGEQQVVRPGNDPIADIANEVQGNSKASVYVLQVGAYTASTDAEQQKARLAMQGFEAKISEREAGGTKFFRVRIGPFAKIDEAERAREKLRTTGIDAAVIKTSK